MCTTNVDIIHTHTTHTHVHSHAHTHMHAQTHAHTHARIYLPSQMHTLTHTHIYTHKCTLTHTHTHTLSHTHTHTLLPLAPQDTSGVEDWRKDLLQAVENLLQHERDLLSTTLSASSIEREGDSSASREYQKLLQDQVGVVVK